MSSEHSYPISCRIDRSDEELIERLEEGFEPINLARGDTRNKENADEHKVMDGEEKRAARSVPQAAGFWHPIMGNVRSHVLKLWFRTGTRSVSDPLLAVSIPTRWMMQVLMFTTSHDTICIHLLGAVLVLCGFVPHPSELLLSHCLRGGL